MAKTISPQPFHVLIAAAGVGARMGADLPKQYMDIGGKPLLRHTIDNARSWAGVKSLRVIIHADHRALYNDAITGLDLPPPIIGDNTRSSSIFNGLTALGDVDNVTHEDIVFIHDGARPFTHKDDIAALCDELAQSRAVSLCAKVSDTVRIKNKDGDAGDALNRDTLRALQTPQGFRYGDIMRAHEHADTETATDDSALMSALGIDVALVDTHYLNSKITTPQDFKLAQAILGNTMNNDISNGMTNDKKSPTTPSHPAPDIRTGLGFDVHAFETAPSLNAPSKRKLMLCGVHVEHTHALAGHSDADVGLHALTDALLGACGAGDIGRHFPPSDDTFKNMDSAVFLEKAVQICTHDMGGRIMNADITLICEMPKITPHAPAMTKRIAALLGIEHTRINVKATTSERLGFTGRGEGIAAQAVVSVVF